MKRAVLYARVSTDAQQKEGTIESQVLELKLNCRGCGPQGATGENRNLKLIF